MNKKLSASRTSSPSLASSRASQRRGFTLVELLVVIGILVVLVSLLTPATRNARGAARVTQCRNNLKQIAYAIDSYRDHYNSFPPAITFDANQQPLHSWRTLILPHMDQASLYNRVDLSKPWNDSANHEISLTQLSAYQCPITSPSKNQTTYLGVIGENSFFHPTEARTKIDFGYPKVPELAMLFEVTVEQKVPWMSPQDVRPEQAVSMKEQVQSQHLGRGHAVLSDCVIVNFDLSSDEELMKLLQVSPQQ